jgi:hypothetical protein
MTKQLTTLMLLILTSIICFGQFNYSAVLVDRISNEPLSFVKVLAFINEDTIRVSTDIDGRFTLANLMAERHRIIATDLGYSLLDTTLLLENNWASDTLKCNGPNLNGRIVRLGYNKNTALTDIKDETIFLLVPGGIVGTKINPVDTLFEQKYKLKYISRGCTKFSIDNEKEYNQTIFDYLDKTYGKFWRIEVRQDIIGLKR